MHVKELNIKKFRHIEDAKILFDKPVIAIAGQNGTGKSTLLGLIGHVYTYQRKYKTISGAPFTTQFSEIFHFSYPTFDQPKTHEYSVLFSDNKEVRVHSSERGKKTKRLRLLVGKKIKGHGKRDYPVIYLGLRRLFPLAQDNKISMKNVISLDDSEMDIYKKLHNEILLLEGDVKPQDVKSRIKNFMAASSNNYDAKGNSAGQDNLGHIITALLSFKKLKDKRKKQYKGGMLLIDEIDASLHAFAQERLVKTLFSYASALNLQVIFTTHSLEILNLMANVRYKNNTRILYLVRRNGKVFEDSNVDIRQITNDLLADNRPDGRVNVYCEDKEAGLFIKALLPDDVLNKITFIDIPFGKDELKALAKKKLPDLQKSIIVLDGDGRNEDVYDNIVFLPGNERPENILFKFLKNLNDGDSFWGPTGEYTKQICFKEQYELNSDRNIMKKWFNMQLPFWGPNGEKIFGYWKEKSPEAVQGFVEQFNKILSVLKPC